MTAPATGVDDGKSALFATHPPWDTIATSVEAAYISEAALRIAVGRSAHRRKRSIKHYQSTACLLEFVYRTVLYCFVLFVYGNTCVNSKCHD